MESIMTIFARDLASFVTMALFLVAMVAWADILRTLG